MNFFEDWWMFDEEFRVAIIKAMCKYSGDKIATNEVHNDFLNALLMGGEIAR